MCSGIMRRDVRSERARTSASRKTRVMLRPSADTSADKSLLSVTVPVVSVIELSQLPLSYSSE